MASVFSDFMNGFCHFSELLYVRHWLLGSVQLSGFIKRSECKMTKTVSEGINSLIKQQLDILGYMPVLDEKIDTTQSSSLVLAKKVNKCIFLNVTKMSYFL